MGKVWLASSSSESLMELQSDYGWNWNRCVVKQLGEGQHLSLQAVSGLSGLSFHFLVAPSPLGYTAGEGLKHKYATN